MVDRNRLEPDSRKAAGPSSAPTSEPPTPAIEIRPSAARHRRRWFRAFIDGQPVTPFVSTPRLALSLASTPPKPGKPSKP